jgi:hypothetical protein
MKRIARFYFRSLAFQWAPRRRFCRVNRDIRVILTGYLRHEHPDEAPKKFNGRSLARVLLRYQIPALVATTGGI